MKQAFESDSFRESPASRRIRAASGEGAATAPRQAECASLPMSDGGEGTLEALKAAKQGEEISLYVFNGMGRRMRAKLFTRGDEARIDAATTCGLGLFDPRELDPLVATSNGVGAFISHALFHGCKRIFVGLGRTCTNDGGMGCLHALGIRFFDGGGNELAGCGADLARVASIDESGLLPQAREAEFMLLCDAANPLLGPNGATHAFGPAKGADAPCVERIEAGMRNFADVIAKTHPDVDFSTPGYGAAGGLGMALSVFLNAKISLQASQPHVPEVLKAVDVGAQLVEHGI